MERKKLLKLNYNTTISQLLFNSNSTMLLINLNQIQYANFPNSITNSNTLILKLIVIDNSNTNTNCTIKKKG